MTEATRHGRARLIGEVDQPLDPAEPDPAGRFATTSGAVDAGGRLIAFTQLGGYAGSRWYAEQWDTIVAPEHRGHRLGTLIKVANLRYAREQCPQLRVIDTWNADSNPYMIGINEAMGFRPRSRTGEWQLDLCT